jgi:ABC-2 type transport system ATP-binding protein
MIRFSKLKKVFRKRTVLDELDLSIEPGERIALVGSNGAGKTTLIRCLLGEYTHSGIIDVNGHSPRVDRTQVLQKVGFVPQLPPPLKMPVSELLRFAAGVTGSSVERFSTLAGRLGLDVKSFGAQPFFKLSGGQKQKLLIAIALGRDVELLILDEPAANLDPEARGVFFSLLSERLAGTTMLISSHRLDEVAALVNRVVELDAGKVTLDDRVADAPLTGKLACRLVLRREDAAVVKALVEWGFIRGDGLEWRGSVPGADRLRFMGMLSRYIGLVTTVSIDEQHEALKLVSS